MLQGKYTVWQPERRSTNTAKRCVSRDFLNRNRRIHSLYLCSNCSSTPNSNCSYRKQDTHGVQERPILDYAGGGNFVEDLLML